MAPPAHDLQLSTYAHLTICLQVLEVLQTAFHAPSASCGQHSEESAHLHSSQPGLLSHPPYFLDSSSPELPLSLPD